MNNDDTAPVDEFDDAPVTEEIPHETMRALVFGVGYTQSRSAR